MRIALVTNLPTHYRRPLFERLADAIDVDFYFTDQLRDWFVSPRSQLSTGRLHAQSVRKPLILFRALRRGRYDCVVISLVGRATLVAALAAARLSGARVVVWTGLWEHPRTMFHRLSRPVVRAIYRRSDALLVYGKHVARFVEAESGRAENVFVLPQAVDNAEFRREVPGEALQAMRDRIGSNGRVAGFVGRLAEDKGLETLLAALARTKAPLTLVLAGSGPQEEDLELRAEKLGVSERVRFLGYVEQRQLPALLRCLDFLILPSISTRRFRETWGLVANEAMNCALPVIATTAVGAAAGGLVLDGETGLVVPERDAGKLVEAMNALATDDALRERLGRRADEHVRAWNLEAGVDAVLAAVRAAVSRREVVASASPSRP